LVQAIALRLAGGFDEGEGLDALVAAVAGEAELGLPGARRVAEATVQGGALAGEVGAAKQTQD
jgi:hypothetical protein